MKRLLSLLLLAGCNSILGIGNDHFEYTGDGGPTDGAVPDAVPPDALPPCPSNTVCGVANILHTSEQGDTTTSGDFSQFGIQAYIPDSNAATGFDVVDGTGTSQGTFTIDNVPDGTTYYLKLTSPSGYTAFFVTDLHSVDDSGFAGGRVDAQTMTQSTNVHFQITGAQPYHHNDLVPDLTVAETYNVASEYYGLEQIADTPPAQDETGINFNVDWRNTYSQEPSGAAQIVDASKGDIFYLTHMQPTWQQDNFGRYQAVERTIDQYTSNSVMMTNGTGLTIGGASATFTPIPQDKTIHFAMNKGAYDAAFPDGDEQYGSWINTFLGGYPYASGASIAVWPNPFSRPVTLGPGEPTVDFDFTGSVNNNTSIDATYGDPYPASWSRWIYIQYNRSRWYRVPGAQPRGIFSGYNRIMLAPVTTTFPATPDVQAVSNWTIAGVDAFSGGRIDMTGPSAPITMSWTPVASAQLYRINVIKLLSSGGKTTFQGVGSLSTRDSTIQIPAELLSGGEWWAFTISSVRNGNKYASGVLDDDGNAYSHAIETSGRFRLLSTCGNGTVESGEDCDPDGTTSTALCNVDCTTPVCGDGIRNALHGEACDTIKDSFLCNADCTPATCGDGYVNYNVEDCDDGNTANDSNGCSASCKAINTCGDGVLEPAVEDCDKGVTPPVDIGDGCSVTCRRNVGSCGDGVVQSGVERCDGADCSPDCKVDTLLCGNGIVDSGNGEQCDPPNGTTCNSSCEFM